MPITRCCNNNKIERKFKEKKFDLKNTQRRSILDIHEVKGE